MAVKRLQLKNFRLGAILRWRVPLYIPLIVMVILLGAIYIPREGRAMYRAAKWHLSNNTMVENVGNFTGKFQRLSLSLSIPNPFGSKHKPARIAPLFTRQVTHWEPEILKWSEEYNLEPNLLATVMQIESCGHPTVNSYAGAQGLFQVMPFHFASTENMLDPDTNAMRGANFLNDCLGWSEGNVGLALACYNGGPSVLQKNSTNWDQQVRDYYKWGTGIYADALTSKNESETLSRWLDAGGINLCNQASAAIGLQ